MPKRQVEARVQTRSRSRRTRMSVEELARQLGTRVRIVEANEQRGRIEIEYYSQEELQRLYQRIITV